MRVAALLATYNEERFIAGCLEHLIRNGVEAYLIDNSSTDRTVELAKAYLGRGLIGIETLPRAGVFRLRGILKRKEELADALDADWFMHLDADEIRLPPRSGLTLAEAFARVDERGYNAVNFLEFTFIPTREAPDHDHPDFMKTMRWYYPYKTDRVHQLKAWRRPDPGDRPAPGFLRRIGAWKRRPKADLAWSAGHLVRFPGLRVSPESFRMRHYMFLSVPHAIEKYANRNFDRKAVRAGWHGWRAKIRESTSLELPSQSELREYVSDDRMDPSNPRVAHHVTL